MDSLHLKASPYERVMVHPLVAFNVLDHWIRREVANSRVIGALVGSVEDGVVEIRNCFPVPHSEEEKIAIDIDHYKAMTSLHSRVAPEDSVVGWYATGGDVRESSSLIHNFFAREIGQPPVHLLLDPDVAKGRIQLNTYHSVNVTFGDKSMLQQQFLPITNEYLVQDQDRITIDILSQSKTSERTLLSDLSNLEVALKRVLDMVDTVAAYVDKVISGDVVPNSEIGRFLQQTLATLPTTEASFDQMFTNGVQDVLMVVYLANLTRSHLLLGEKLRDQQVQGAQL